MIQVELSGKGSRLLAALAGVMLMGAGQAVLADLPLPHTGSADVNAPLLHLTNTNGGTNAWAFRGTGTYGFVGDSSVIGGAGARGTFFDAVTGDAKASGNLGRSDASGNYYGVWGRLFPGSPQGAAVYGLSDSGGGDAAYFETTNLGGLGRALVAVNRGHGGAGLFVTNHPASTAVTLDALHLGHNGGAAVQGAHGGTLGNAGVFSIDNLHNPSYALYAKTIGGGGAGLFRIINPASGARTLEVRHDGKGACVSSEQAGTRGSAGVFQVLNTANPSSAMFARTFGTGRACNCVGDSLVGGDLDVTGGLTPSAAAIKIDHPLDPANRYLQLPAITGPDLKNVLDGVVVLDQNGEALVGLPEWFGAANGDFRYQLTAIGGPAPELHVAQEVQSNAFLIAGGPAGLKVSWQVTGIRQDAYALLQPITVEADKPADEVGLYRHPEAYGLSEEFGVDHEKYEQYLAASADAEEVMIEVPQEEGQVSIEE